MVDELVLARGREVFMLELAPEAKAPGLTRLRIRQADWPGGPLMTVAEIPLVTGELEALAQRCHEHAERARPHMLAALEAAFAHPAGVAREW